MSRVGESRPAARPSTAAQQARRDRIVHAARRLTADRDHELVQMQEVAAEADVALATLYRYFPSKTQLYVGLMADEVGAMGRYPAPDPDHAPDEAVFAVLLQATRRFVRRPSLATAMVQSANIASKQAAPEVREIDDHVQDLLLRAAGVGDATSGDRRLVRLLVQLWYGVLQSCLNGHITLAEAEGDLWEGCRLLLRPLSDAVGRSSGSRQAASASRANPPR